MNAWALVGLLLIAYAAAVLFVAIKKPPAIWNMAKIRLFIKILGSRGTQIFFIVFAMLSAGVGLWLMIR